MLAKKPGANEVHILDGKLTINANVDVFTACASNDATVAALSDGPDPFDDAEARSGGKPIARLESRGGTGGDLVLIFEDMDSVASSATGRVVIRIDGGGSHLTVEGGAKLVQEGVDLLQLCGLRSSGGSSSGGGGGGASNQV